ncbi:DUF6891 domain-containing protein [Sanguibacter suarezii]|uniref:DUF6891 domain-containing protein n=1 Tax=Sanguibacter suarezii TaxID=60921 RepID=UPI00082A9C18|nr:hypothetical protein [Sanguibacter suarezii]
MTTPTTGPGSRYSRADVAARARAALSAGFVDLEGAIAQVSLAFTDEEQPPPGSVIPSIVREVWQARLAEQSRWRDEGDYTRLAAAFNNLAEWGMVARMNFTCCQTCGNDEIADERTPVPSDGYGGYMEWGYAYFHQQDTDRLTEGADLFLAYGTFAPITGLDPDLLARADAGDAAARTQVMDASLVRAGTVVADALRYAGLGVTWDGTPGQRIAVTITDWRKRLPA